MSLQDHAAEAHTIKGSPYEQMRRIVARHLCDWISGHEAPVDHFLTDADLIMSEAHEHGLRIGLVGGTSNAASGLVEVSCGD